MSTTVSANNASKSCILGIQLTHWCMVPVKSRNNSVMPMNITVASAILIFLNIKYCLASVCYFDDLYTELIEQVDGQCHYEEGKHVGGRGDDSRYDEDGYDGVTAEL